MVLADKSTPRFRLTDQIHFETKIRTGVTTAQRPRKSVR
jgi:hypothetical protein